MSREVGVSLNVEGRYMWIVFLPSKTHAGVPVLNRYYGVFDTGKIKVRGIEVRRSDTPRFIHDAQMDMIKVLAKAHNAIGFMDRIPDALDVLREYVQRLVEGKASTKDLLIAKRLSLHPSKYAHDVLQAIAAKQLVKEGVEISAGQTVQYLITNSKSRSALRRVRPAQLLNTSAHYDTEKYVHLLLSSAANILSPFGYTTNNLYDLILHSEEQKPLQ